MSDFRMERPALRSRSTRPVGSKWLPYQCRFREDKGEMRADKVFETRWEEGLSLFSTLDSDDLQK
jgi:hypothetical protein